MSTETTSDLTICKICGYQRGHHFTPGLHCPSNLTHSGAALPTKFEPVDSTTPEYPQTAEHKYTPDGKGYCKKCGCPPANLIHTLPDKLKDETHGSTIVATTSKQYWGKGNNVESALDQCRKAGASGSQDVLLYAYHGPRHKLDEITVNGMGDIEYPQGVVSIRVGMLKLNVSTQPKPKK